MDPRIWKSRLVDKLGVLITHAHHDEDAIVKVVVWDAFWGDVNVKLPFFFAPRRAHLWSLLPSPLLQQDA